MPGIWLSVLVKPKELRKKKNKQKKQRVRSGLTHAMDVLTEGLAPVLCVFKCVCGKHVSYVLPLTLCIDVYFLAIGRISVRHTDNGILGGKTKNNFWFYYEKVQNKSFPGGMQKAETLQVASTLQLIYWNTFCIT